MMKLTIAVVGFVILVRAVTIDSTKDLLQLVAVWQIVTWIAVMFLLEEMSKRRR